MTIGPKKQKGAVLIIGLLLMIVLTLIGLTSMRTTRLETMMSTNAKESAIAFEAAEAAQRDAEQLIEDSVSIVAFAGANGLLGIDDVEPDYQDPASWGSGNSQQYSETFADVATQPRFIVKYIGEISSDPTQSPIIGDYGSTAGNPTVSLFRVTSRGTGRNDSAVALIQTYYGKIY